VWRPQPSSLRSRVRFCRRLSKPIQHGLCTYGIACKALVDAFLDGDVAQAGSYAARFAGVLFPGETLKASIWKQDGKFVGVLTAPERGDAVALIGWSCCRPESRPCSATNLAQALVFISSGDTGCGLRRPPRRRR
jgi:hypothetical protein